MEKVQKTEAEWKKELTPEQYKILREKGTEVPFSGEYVHAKDKGMYTCAACGFELFSSDDKYDSGTGWPSFTKPVKGDAVATEEDQSLGMRRTEVICPRCGSHLGHLFDDGPGPDGKRYCINSACLRLNTGKA